MSGRVVHFELPFESRERARTFYGEIFGWDVQPMPELDYVAVTTGPTSPEAGPAEPGFVNGGMVPREEAIGHGTVITIDVEDIDATLARVEALGGKPLQEKLPVGSMGFTAYFQDCEGNVVGLWETNRG